MVYWGENEGLKIRISVKSPGQKEYQISQSFEECYCEKHQLCQ